MVEGQRPNLAGVHRHRRRSRHASDPRFVGEFDAEFWSRRHATLRTASQRRKFLCPLARRSPTRHGHPRLRVTRKLTEVERRGNRGSFAHGRHPALKHTIRGAIAPGSAGLTSFHVGGIRVGGSAQFTARATRDGKTRGGPRSAPLSIHRSIGRPSASHASSPPSRNATGMPWDDRRSASSLALSPDRQ